VPLAAGAEQGGGQCLTCRGWLRLPAQVRGLPPASASVVVRNPALVPEDNALEGRTLSLAYQLKDAANR
jgi:hypothetical protein